MNDLMDYEGPEYEDADLAWVGWALTVLSSMIVAYAIWYVASWVGAL